jgi:hypothetical protein
MEGRFGFDTFEKVLGVSLELYNFLRTTKQTSLSQKEKDMIKTKLLLLALTVSLLAVAESTLAAEADFTTTATTGGRSVTEVVAAGTGETKGKEMNGSIPGQFLPGTLTDFVRGEGSSTRPASDAVWNGFVIGTAALAPRETEDVALLPSFASKGTGAWGGYVTGSLGYWQRRS